LRRSRRRRCVIGVLHTWTRALIYHPHVHLLVTNGGLTPDGQTWRKTRNPRFLVPGRVLSVIFRAKIRDALRQAGLLDAALPRRLRRRKWVVHCQYAGAGDKVLDYLGRYLYRVAIANSRLESFEEGLVTFRYRDNRTGKTLRCTLEAQRFIARFLQHVLPRGFSKVRSWGLFSPTSRTALERARSLLDAHSHAEPAGNQRCPSQGATRADDQRDDPLCPRCQLGHLRIVATLPRASSTSSLAAAARAPP
jgi:hypothetical protein